MLGGQRFAALWETLGACGEPAPALERLRAAYAEPQRAYHDARHIAACLALLDEPEVGALATNRAEVEAALWFHDAIYDPRAHDNEERSAELAGGILGAGGVAPEVVERVAALVLATKDHSGDSADSRLVVDIDLSILGAPAAEYERFEEEIRREYAWVEPAAFTAGRAAVLRRFAEREHVYHTPLFRARYEAAARSNIAAALRRLGG